MIKVGKAGACPDCGMQAIPLYDENDKRITNLPSYCDHCEVLWVDGEKTDISEEAKKQFKLVAEQAKQASLEVKEELQKNPEERIQKYFERVFHWAFAEGFVRAFAYFKYKAQTGRFKRIKELWEKGSVDYYKGHFSKLSNDEMRELDKLIRWTK
jgi:hypothetical protein